MKNRIELLKHRVIENKNIIPYINLNENNTYKGWVSDFHISFDNEEDMRLDLSQNNDLFLLFVLAIAWSRSGQWENAAYFVAYLKYHGYSEPQEWKNKKFVKDLSEKRHEEAVRVYEYCSSKNLERKKISFRADIYESINILACRWEDIINKLNEANEDNDYESFVYYMYSIEGLGFGRKRMLIKIVLILRELRCQKIYHNIPGYLCCVPDKRVKTTCKKMGINIPIVKDAKSLINASAILYKYFGDLYDIPAFAYDDIMDRSDIELWNCVYREQDEKIKKIMIKELKHEKSRGCVMNMKSDVKTISKIEQLFQLYEQEIKELEKNGVTQANTMKTYLLHSGNFVRWCKGEFEPGAKNKC